MKNSKKLLIICPYPEGVAPSQRLKYEQYFDEIRKEGWEITVEPFINTSFWKIIYKKGAFLQKAFFTIKAYIRRLLLLHEIKDYDVIYVHLWVTPFGPPIFEKWIRKRSKKMIYDIDDLVYLKSEKNKAHPLVALIKGRKKPLYLIQAADHVITCTPYLDEFVRKFNTNTTDISSTVDTEEKYVVANNYSNEKPVIIGWSGSLSTSKYFYLLEKVFKKLAETHSFQIKVMGDPHVTIQGLNIESIEWKNEYEMEVLKSFDIGVYPLPEEEWVLGKSGLKAIQYMALGIPTVATAIGANFRVIENGVSGFLVENESEWVEALSKLIEDPGLRAKMGAEARKRVEEQFSVKANAATYLGILNK
jgi:L-malate glycosyltransferase